MKKMKIFVVNPGSTSTKVAYFEDEKCLFSDDVFHDSSILRSFATFNDQLPYRMEVIRQFLKDRNIDLTGLDAVVGRGGSCASVESGIYKINEKLLEDTRNAVSGTWHSSMLGVQMAEELQKEYGGEMYMLDPIVVDEYQDLARVTGVKGIYRRAVCHALNQKAIARRYAEDAGRKYEDLNLIAQATGFSTNNISFVCYERPQFVESSGKGFGVTDILQILLAVLIFALLGYVVFRSTRKQQEEELEPELSVESLLESTAAKDADDLENIGYAEKSETRVMIEKFVDENPGAAALLLRNWLNEDWD